MKLYSTLPLLFYTSALVYAETDGAVFAHFGPRRVALEQFTYSVPTSPASTIRETRGAAQSEPVEGDTVVMRKISITDRLDERELRRDILKTRPAAATSDTKFGTGLREKDFGKVRATAATVLYIPIRVGISW